MPAGIVLLALIGAIIIVLPARDQYGLREKLSFEENTAYVYDQVVNCLKSGEPNWRGSCFRNLGELLSSQFTLPESLSALSAIDDREGIKQQCHALVHYLGQNEYEKQKDLAATFRSCLSSPVACGEGCFHGAVEGYVSKHGGQLNPSAISDICDREFTENEVTYDACVHGLGHALMLQYEGDIHQSLTSCRALPDLEDREFCYDGVFMENVFSFWTPEHGSKFIRTEEPTYPCTEVAPEFQNSCYSSQAGFVIGLSLERGPMPAYKDAAAFCEKAPESVRASCYTAIGGDAILTARSPEDIRDACMLAPKGPGREACYTQALVFLGHGSAGDPNTVSSLCAVLGLIEQPACFAGAGEIMESWFPGKRAEMCGRIAKSDDDIYSWCTGRTGA